jgi:hypothetical protein
MADKNEIYVANTSGVATVPNNEDGTQIQFKKGDRYRGNHPLVKQCPLFFDLEMDHYDVRNLH